MIHSLRKSLIILIALLQLVAPLVHAHTSGMQGAFGGIHLPGLEFINSDKFKPGLRAEAPGNDGCGMAIGVSCGVERAKASLDSAAIFNSHAQLEIFCGDFIAATTNFSPQQTFEFNHQTVLQPISPRAPPFFPSAV